MTYFTITLVSKTGSDILKLRVFNEKDLNREFKKFSKRMMRGEQIVISKIESDQLV